MRGSQPFRETNHTSWRRPVLSAGDGDAPNQRNGRKRQRRQNSKKQRSFKVPSPSYLHKFSATTTEFQEATKLQGAVLQLPSQVSKCKPNANSKSRKRINVTRICGNKVQDSIRQFGSVHEKLRDKWIQLSSSRDPKTKFEASRADQSHENLQRQSSRFEESKTDQGHENLLQESSRMS